MSKTSKGTIAILTGGGDVPGLNPAIRGATIRANRNGYRVIGLRNGWEGIMKIDRTKPVEDQKYCQILTERNVQKIARYFNNVYKFNCYYYDKKLGIKSKKPYNNLTKPSYTLEMVFVFNAMSSGYYWCTYQ